MATDKTLNAIRPSEASRNQAMDLAKRRGFLEQEEFLRWLEEYFAERVGVAENGYDKDALAVADALYDHVSATWLAGCFKIPVYSLRIALGKDGFTKCEGEGCEELVPSFLLRVKNGYSTKGESPRRALCPSCKKVFDESRREMRLAVQERYEDSQRREERDRRQAEMRRAELLLHLPRRGRGHFAEFLSQPNALRIALTHAANKVLTTPVQIVATARFKPTEIRWGWGWSWTDYDGFQDTKIVCEQCYRDSGLAIYSRDLLDVYFSFVVQHEFSEFIGRDEMPALRYLIANGEEAFASSLLREWVRGKVFGNPNFSILCSECSGNDDFVSGAFFKISRLEETE